MEIYSFVVDQNDVDEGLQEGGEGYRVGNEQPAPGHSYPYIYFCDGDKGIGVRFQSKADVSHFQELVGQLEYESKDDE